MNTFLQTLENRTLLSGDVSLVKINGQSFLSSDAEDGYRMLVASKLKVQSAKKLGAKAAAAATDSGFNITLKLSGSVSSEVQSAFDAAVARWETYITDDVPNVSGVDDILITASVTSIDGEGGVLGQAGPTAVRKNSDIPTKGIMQFDSADLADLAASGQLEQVIFHEMGHVLGIGTMWSSAGLLSGTTTSSPVFTGSNAVAAYQALGGTGSGVPVEADGGDGTAFGHWDEDTFGNEIMTGYLNSGYNPTSTITLASLLDLGYTGVELSLADAYSIPGLSDDSNTGTETDPDAGTDSDPDSGTDTDPDTDTDTPTTPTIPATGDSTITGTVFLDSNSNGVFDSSVDSPLAGATAFLDSNYNGTLDDGEIYSVSDDSGAYSLSNLGTGTYILRFIAPEGYGAVTPSGYRINIFSTSQITLDFGVGTYTAQPITPPSTTTPDLSGNGCDPNADVTSDANSFPWTGGRTARHGGFPFRG